MQLNRLILANVVLNEIARQYPSSELETRQIDFVIRTVGTIAQEFAKEDTALGSGRVIGARLVGDLAQQGRGK